MLQKVKTRVIKGNVNPEWNDYLTLGATDPHVPIKLVSASQTRRAYEKKIKLDLQFCFPRCSC